MLLAALALTHLLQSCAPNIGPRTMTAIIHVESGGNPLAVHDNTLGRSFYPKTKQEGVRLAEYLLAKHHSLDLGISQVNSANLTGLGMSVGEAFDPCTNIRNGARILAGAYRRAVAQFGPGQYALRRAIGAYNTGSLFAGDRYISMILDAAGIHDTVANVSRVPNLASQSGQPPQEKSRPRMPMQRNPRSTPIVTAAVPEAPAQIPMPPVQAPVSPEDSPILVKQPRYGGAMLASGMQHMTHISPNQTRMTHIPVTTLNQQQQSPQQQQQQQAESTDQGNPQESDPIVLRALPPGAMAAQPGETPQQQLLREAAAMQRRR